MTKDDIAKKIMDMKCDVKDTFTMPKAAEKVPTAMLPRVVSISPQGGYSTTNTFDIAPTIVTTTTTQAGTGTVYIGTAGGTATDGGTTTELHLYPPQGLDEEMTFQGAPFAWDAYYKALPKRRRKKKAIRPPIQISPRNPGMRRIVLED